MPFYKSILFLPFTAAQFPMTPYMWKGIELMEYEVIVAGEKQQFTPYKMMVADDGTEFAAAGLNNIFAEVSLSKYDRAELSITFPGETDEEIREKLARANNFVMCRKPGNTLWELDAEEKGLIEPRTAIVACENDVKRYNERLRNNKLLEEKKARLLQREQSVDEIFAVTDIAQRLSDFLRFCRDEAEKSGEEDSLEQLHERVFNSLMGYSLLCKSHDEVPMFEGFTEYLRDVI